MRFKSSIRFENVGFSYSNEEGEHQILHNVDLEVSAGEVLALVGPSGAGKSTLVNLIPRFFDVTSGRILIDGRDIRDVTLSFAAHARSRRSRRRRSSSTTRCATTSPMASRM